MVNKQMRKRVGWSLIAFSAYGLVWGSQQQAPFVIESPGSVTNVLGKSDGVEVLQGNFPDEESFGAIDMLTVSVDGYPGSTPTFYEVLAALFSDDRAIYPLELVYPEGSNFEEEVEASEKDLADSSKSALVAAQMVLPGGVVEKSQAKVVLENVGGPSGGLAFTLGFIDKLTPGSLTGGKSLAVTGTIDDRGAVGEIGGIQQKIYGAKLNGDEFLLMPLGNCYELNDGHLKLIRVIPVRDLKEALAAVKVISADGDIDSLPTCSAK
jgi:PDZ domain-containing protein